MPPQSWVFPGMAYNTLTTPLGTHSILLPASATSNNTDCSDIKTNCPAGIPLRGHRVQLLHLDASVRSCCLSLLCTTSNVLLSLSFLPCFPPLPAFVLPGSLESHIYILHIWQVFLVKRKKSALCSLAQWFEKQDWLQLERKACGRQPNQTKIPRTTLATL